MFIQGFLKTSGGPGSGVPGRNTKKIGLPTSPYVSVGTRGALLENMPFTKKTIPLSAIKFVGQENFVPAKLKKFITHPEWITEEPIDVLEASGRYHVIDGHHRYLAARSVGLKELEARVYKKRKDKKEP